MVTLVFTSNADTNVAANDVRQNLESIKRTLPTDAESPQVLKFDIGQMPIVTFAITTPGDDVRLIKSEVEDILINPLRRVPGVGSVLLSMHRSSYSNRRPSRPTLSSRSNHDRTRWTHPINNMNIPAGDLTVEDLRFSIRMTGEQDSTDSLRKLPLMKSPIGNGMILLRDIADVYLDLKDETELAYVNGNTTILGYIRKTGDANVVDVATKASDIFEQAKENLPTGTQIQVMESGAVFIEGTITNLTNTALTWSARILNRLPISSSSWTHCHYCQCDSTVHHRDIPRCLRTWIHPEFSDIDRLISVCWNGRRQRCGSVGEHLPKD